MRTDWYKNVNPNLDRLAQILDMATQGGGGGMPKPSHGYTIAEKAPEVVTAPGVYFPAEKGEVIPLQSRQTGGSVIPSKPSSKDNDTRKLDMLESIIASVKPSNLESRSLGGSVIPQQGELEKLKIEQSKYDILKSAISVLKPQGQQKSPSNKKTSTDSSRPSESEKGNIPLESRQMGGEVDPALDILKSIMMPNIRRKLPYGERTSQYGSRPFGSEKTLFPSLPGIPKPPTAQSYGLQPEATKLGVADKGISEGDLLWQKKRAEAGWANPAQDLWEHKREEGGWSAPMFSRADGGLVTPETEEEKRRRLLEESMGTPPQPVPAPPPTEQVPAGLEGFITNIKRTPTGTVYTGPEGQATVGPERFFLGDKEVPTGTPGAISGDVLARERLSAETKKQETERELMSKGLGFGRDLGYWAAHPEEKTQYDFEQMIGRGKFTATQRAELTKQYIASKGLLDVAGLKPGKEPAPHLVQNEKGEYVWATPGGVLPAGIMGKAPQPRAEALPSFQEYKRIPGNEGKTYEDFRKWETGLKEKEVATSGLREFEIATGVDPSTRGTPDYSKSYMEFLGGKKEATRDPIEQKKLGTTLRKEFNALQPIKDYRDIETRFNIMGKAIKESKTTKNFVAVDQALITIFNKMTDPQSVVRESEYLRTPQDLALWNRIKGKVSKMAAGGAGLTPDDRNALYSMAKQFQSAYESKFNQLRNEYRGYAVDYGLDPEIVIKGSGGEKTWKQKPDGTWVQE